MLRAFTLKLPDGSSLSFDVEAVQGHADSGVLADDLVDLFVAVGQATRASGVGLLVAIDELQYIESAALGGLITAIHRTTQMELPVILVGTGLPQIPGLAGDAKSYAERLFDFPRIDSLAPEDAADVLAIPASEHGVGFDPLALDLIVSETHGYPYFLQEWGHHTWNVSDGPMITIEDTEAARGDVIDQLDANFFLVRYDRMTPKEREYLRAMAELGAGPHRSGDIAATLGVKVESVGPRRSLLIKKGMIFSPAHGDTAFTVPLFDDFMKRKMPHWRAA